MKERTGTGTWVGTRPATLLDPVEPRKRVLGGAHGARVRVFLLMAVLFFARCAVDESRDCLGSHQ